MSKYPGKIVTALANTGNSVAFDGNGDRLVLSTNAALDLTGDFTVECWIYPTAISTFNVIFDTSLNGTAGANMTELFIASPNTLTYYVQGANLLSGTGITLNSWHHVAVTKSGTTQRLFLNGALLASATSSTQPNTGYSWYIGDRIAGAPSLQYPFSGYISNFRVVKGTALYTAAFTPPTQLFNITNTSLLTCNSATFTDQSNNALAITVNGNAAVSTFTPFRAYVPYNPALGASTPGAWTLDEAMYARATRQWNMYDPYFNQTMLLLRSSSADGTQNNQFLDSSTNNFTITRNPTTGPNAPTQGTFSPFSQTGWSYFGSATTDKLTASSVDPGNFGSSAFTIEAWVHFNDIGTTRVVASNYQSSTVGWTIYRNTSNFVTFHGSGDGADITSTTAVVVGRWYHIAVSGTPTSPGIRLFINGVQEGSTYTGAVSLNSTNAVVVGDGAGGAAGVGINGYISNLRLLKGTALYTTNFTPPTTPLTNITNTSLLTCQSNRFVDNGTANSGSGYTFTVGGTPSVQPFSPFLPTRAYTPATIGGSGYFDGTGDWLSSTSTINFGSNAFTIEFWLYTGTPSTTTMPFSLGTSGALQIQASTGSASNNGNISIGTYGSGASLTTVNSPIIANQWNHIVAVRSSTGTNGAAIFINGSRNVLGTVPTTYVAGAIQIGGISTGAQLINGYMSGLIVTNGTANYSVSDTSIPLPTAPPSPTGSALCLNFTNAAITDATGKNNLETVGNAQASVAVRNTRLVTTPPTSMYFDGTGDYLFIPASLTNRLLGDFTVEFWIYPLTLPGSSVQNGVMGINTAGSNGMGILLENPGRVSFFVNGNATITQSPANSISATTWTHVALVRAGTTNTLYINGALAITSTTASGFGTTPAIHVGRVYGDNTSIVFNGYLDDFRITRFARYTAAFTPPRSRLQEQ